MSNLLPTDARLLKALAARPIPVGSRSITARQRKMLTADGLITDRITPEYFNWRCYVLTDAGRARLAAYEAVTLEETFK